MRQTARTILIVFYRKTENLRRLIHPPDGTTMADGTRRTRDGNEKKLKGGQLKAESNMGFSFLAVKLQSTYTRSASSNQRSL